MKLVYFIRIALLSALCCAVFTGQGKSYAYYHSQSRSHKHTTLSNKLPGLHDIPANACVAIDLPEGNQEITLQVHKTSTSSQIAYLPPRNFTTYVKCANFFSGYNNQRYTLLSRDFLFPFHAFW